MERLTEINKTKEQAVTELLLALNNTDDFAFGHEIIFILIDNFKDSRIETCLVNLLKSEKWKNRNGILWYALEECSDGQKFLKLLLNTILNNDNEQNGEVFMQTYSMIVNMKPPVSIHSVNWALRRIKKEKCKKNDKFKQSILNSLENFFEGQKGIRKFYKQFMHIDDIDVKIE